MGKHKEYSEDLLNLVVNAVINYGITKAKAARQFGHAHTACMCMDQDKSKHGNFKNKTQIWLIKKN